MDITGGIPYVPSIVEGIVLSREKNRGKDIFPPQYTVQVTMPNGAITVLKSVGVSSVFGGVLDNLQYEANTVEEFKSNPPLEGSQYQTSPGDRVLLAFPGGDARRGYIIAALPHPLQLPRLEGGIQLSLQFGPFTLNITKDTIKVLHRQQQDLREIPGKSVGLIPPVRNPQVESSVSLAADGSFSYESSAVTGAFVEATADGKVSLGSKLPNPRTGSLGIDLVAELANLVSTLVQAAPKLGTAAVGSAPGAAPVIMSPDVAAQLALIQTTLELLKKG